MTFAEQYEALIKLSLREDEKDFADTLWGKTDSGSSTEFYGSVYDIIVENFDKLKSETVKQAARQFAKDIVDVGGIVGKEYELNKSIGIK